MYLDHIINGKKTVIYTQRTKDFLLSPHQYLRTNFIENEKLIQEKLAIYENILFLNKKQMLSATTYDEANLICCHFNEYKITTHCVSKDIKVLDDNFFDHRKILAEFIEEKNFCNTILSNEETLALNNPFGQITRTDIELDMHGYSHYRIFDVVRRLNLSVDILAQVYMYWGMCFKATELPEYPRDNSTLIMNSIISIDFEPVCICYELHDRYPNL